jgi:futalosine hydrolase
MSCRILFVTATSLEADVLKKIAGIEFASGGYRYGNIEISVLVAGVGSVSTAWAMKQWISVNEKPDLAINSGIAGSYKAVFGIGEVVMPVSDCFADAGIEDGDEFRTLYEAGLSGADEFPFRNGHLFADGRFITKLNSYLKPVSAITVNTATGSEVTRARLLKKFNPDIETMEGATFFYICSREEIPFVAIRAISNMVEPRDKNKWDIKTALWNLSEKFKEIFLIFE